MVSAEQNKDFMNLKFENFVNTLDGEDLFDKTERLDEVLSSNIMTGNEALGMVTMNKVQAESGIKEKNGHVHNVIMLGSNSYLNLSTHPQVMEGARQALEKFGYGMGAVSNYAGITDIHKELEKRIANFYGAEDSIVFPSGMVQILVSYLLYAAKMMSLLMMLLITLLFSMAVCFPEQI